MAKIKQKPFLEGEKVYLRPLEREDLKGPYRNWINDHEVTRFIEAGNFPLTDEGMADFYEKNIKSPNSALFAIVEKSSGKHIGNAQVKDINWINRNATRGILLGDKTCWGKGYGFEVAQLLGAYAFERLNLNKLTSITIDGNEAVQKLNKRLGYTLDGRLREEFYCDGKYYTKAVWSILRSDYMGLKEE